MRLSQSIKEKNYVEVLNMRLRDQKIRFTHPPVGESPNLVNEGKRLNIDVEPVEYGFFTLRANITNML